MTSTELKPYSILSVHAVLKLLRFRLSNEPYKDGQDCLNGMIHSIKDHAKKHPDDVYIYSEIGNSDYNGWCFNVGDGDPVYLKEYRENSSAVNWNSFLTTKYSYAPSKAVKQAKFIKHDIHVHPMYYPCVHDYDIKTIAKDRKYLLANKVAVKNV